MLGLFANATFAVKGVAPNAKTLAGLKDMGKKHSAYIAQNFKNDGFAIDDDGSKDMLKSCGYCHIFVDKDGKLDGFCIHIYDVKNEIYYALWHNVISGKLSHFYLRDKDGKDVLVNGYYAAYNPDGSIRCIYDPKGNVV
jgi:hypothetical protein